MFMFVLPGEAQEAQKKNPFLKNVRSEAEIPLASPFPLYPPVD